MGDEQKRAEFHVLMGFTTYRNVVSKSVRTMAECIYHVAVEKKHDFTVAWKDGFPVAGCVHCYKDAPEFEDARNFFARKALEVGATHLFMIDSDMSWGGTGMVSRLMSHDCDIVAPLFMRRSEPYDLLAKRWDKSRRQWVSIEPEEAESKQVLQVDAVGFGAILIKTEVLKKMKYPWFTFEPVKGTRLPEDFNFCRKARREGFSVHVDTGMWVDHVGEQIHAVEDAIEIAKMKRGDM